MTRDASLCLSLPLSLSAQKKRDGLNQMMDGHSLEGLFVLCRFLGQCGLPSLLSFSFLQGYKPGRVIVAKRGGRTEVTNNKKRDSTPAKKEEAGQ